MLKPLVRWGLFVAALFAAGPLAWLATSTMRGVDGGPDTTPMLSGTPLLAMLAAIGAILLAAALGLVTARLVNIHSALFNSGIVLAWAAAGTGTIDAVARASDSPALGWRLMIEGLVLAAVSIPVFAVVCAAAPHHLGERRLDDDRPALVRWGVPVVVGILSGFVGSWLVAQNLLKGQTIAAAAMSGLVAGAVGMVIDRRAAPGAIVAGVFAMAVIAPLAGMMFHGTSLERGLAPTAAVGIKLARFAAVLPLDWLGGGLLGVPMGLSLGAWMTDGRHPKPVVRPG